MIDRVLTPSASAIAVDVADEMIVVDEARGILHLLNPTGALVWRCLDGISPLDEICDDLADVLAVSRSRVTDDVDALALRLLDDGLASTPGYVRPPFPEELVGGGGDCGCDDEGHDHEHDGVTLASNP